MKWNPLPWFVGALLLVVIQYRRYHAEKEVHVDEDGDEVIKLKGPWQVGVPFSSPRVLPIPTSSRHWLAPAPPILLFSSCHLRGL
jgi:phosphatidylserine decarboxylase